MTNKAITIVPVKAAGQPSTGAIPISWEAKDSASAQAVLGKIDALLQGKGVGSLEVTEGKLPRARSMKTLRAVVEAIADVFLSDGLWDEIHQAAGIRSRSFDTPVPAGSGPPA